MPNATRPSRAGTQQGMGGNAGATRFRLGGGFWKLIFGRPLPEPPEAGDRSPTRIGTEFSQAENGQTCSGVKSFFFGFRFFRGLSNGKSAAARWRRHRLFAGRR